MDCARASRCVGVSPLHRGPAGGERRQGMRPGFPFFLVTEMNFDTCRVFAVQVMERAEPANPPCS
jgi:hypothetical protein